MGSDLLYISEVGGVRSFMVLPETGKSCSVFVSCERAKLCARCFGVPSPCAGSVSSCSCCRSPRRGSGGVPVVSRWCPGGVPVVSRWCPGGVPVGSWWCPGGVPVVPRWCPGGVPVVSRWCPGGVPVVSGGVPVHESFINQSWTTHEAFMNNS